MQLFIDEFLLKLIEKTTPDETQCSVTEQLEVKFNNGSTYYIVEDMFLTKSELAQYANSGQSLPSSVHNQSLNFSNEEQKVEPASEEEKFLNSENSRNSVLGKRKQQNEIDNQQLLSNNEEFVVDLDDCDEVESRKLLY